MTVHSSRQKSDLMHCVCVCIGNVITIPMQWYYNRQLISKLLRVSDLLLLVRMPYKHLYSDWLYYIIILQIFVIREVLFCFVFYLLYYIVFILYEWLNCCIQVHSVHVALSDAVDRPETGFPESRTRSPKDCECSVFSITPCPAR